MVTKTLTISVEARDMDALRRRLPNLQLLPGSTGRTEFHGKLVPLGPLMSAFGGIFADRLAPTGAVVTKRGGFGRYDMNAYVEWAIPAQMGRRASMGIGPVALVAVAIALAAALGALGWAISKVTALIKAIVGAADPTTPGGFGLWLGVGLIAFVALGGFGRRRKA